MSLSTREDWLLRAAELLRPVIETLGGDDIALPALRVSVGFPLGSRGGKSTHAIGQCWAATCSADKTHELFISPELSEPARVLDVLAHELVHAAVGIEEGHGKAFGRVARAIGLEGKMTATVAGEAFTQLAATLLPELGPYPHATLLPSAGGAGGPGRSGPRPQGTRMLKAVCDNCSMVIRTTRKWIDTTGLPTCACGGTFEESEPT